MSMASCFLEAVEDIKKQFARELGDLTGLPENHFKINDVSALFAISAATIALHELKSGSLSGRLPFQELSGAMAKVVMPEGARKSTLHKIWCRYKSIKSPDDFRWGELREIGNYLDVPMVRLVPIFEKVGVCHHELARQLSGMARKGEISATLFTNDDAGSAHVKLDSGVSECSSPASDDSNVPSIKYAESSEEPISGTPNKISGTKRRASPRNKKRRDKLFPKDAKEMGSLNQEVGP